MAKKMVRKIKKRMRAILTKLTSSQRKKKIKRLTLKKKQIKLKKVP
jgi:hypothetical protein